MLKTFLVILLISLSSCEKKQQKTSRPIPYVELATAVCEDVPYQLQTIGNTNAFHSVEIRPQVDGQVTGYYFKDGAFVSKGDLLYTIDSRLYEAELEESKGQYQQAIASLEFNTQRQERYKELLPEDYVSVLNYLQYLSDKEIAQGQVTQYDGTVKKAQVDVGYCTIHAPISGRCGKHLIDPGNIVSQDQEQALLVIKQIDPIYADFTLSEQFLPKLQQYSQDGFPVKINVVGEKETFSGWLNFINNTVNSNSGTIKLRAIFDNKEEKLWPGQFVDVRIMLYMIKNATLIPEIAIERDTQGPYVFIAREDHTVEQRRVTLGEQIGTRWVIKSGVKPGEEVVTIGQINLFPGSKYQIRKNTQ